MAKGWLDNYNDYNVSAPEGMEGDGYSNVGRNSSPAWGGQFQNGGKAPKYVESKNNAGYKAYNDSLNLSTIQKQILNEYNKSRKPGYKFTPDKTPISRLSINEKISYPQNPKLKKLRQEQDEIVKRTGYKPIGQQTYTDEKMVNEFESPGLIESFSSLFKPSPKETLKDVYSFTDDVYKEPQQQVIVKDNNAHQYKTIHTGEGEGRFEPIQRQPIRAIKNIKPAGLVHSDLDIEAELPEIRQQIKKPKYYNIEDYTKGSTDYIGNQTNYRTSDLSTLSEQTSGNTRKIIPHYQMGGNLPGAVGNMYARTGAPSKGPRRNQTDVTDASAQNGKEMQYYQQGLDWKPKSISKNGAWLDNYKEEIIIKDDRGQWDHPGEITEINSNDITMQGVPFDVLGVSDTGDTKLMKPGKNYKFKGKKVTEYPMAKNGVNQQDQKTLQQLDQLTNFTNYNKPTIGGWLNKYN